MSTGKFSGTSRIDYVKEAKACSDFIQNFEDYSLNSDPLHGRKKYMRELQRVLDGGQPVIEIALSDIEDYYSKSDTQSLALHIATNSRRYIKLFSDAADDVIEETKMRRLTPQSDQEDFEDALNNFRLNNFDKTDGPKPPKEIMNLLKRKL